MPKRKVKKTTKKKTASVVDTTSATTDTFNSTVITTADSTMTSNLSIISNVSIFETPLDECLRGCDSISKILKETVEQDITAQMLEYQSKMGSFSVDKLNAIVDYIGDSEPEEKSEKPLTLRKIKTVGKLTRSDRSNPEVPSSSTNGDISDDDENSNVCETVKRNPAYQSKINKICTTAKRNPRSSSVTSTRTIVPSVKQRRSKSNPLSLLNQAGSSRSNFTSSKFKTPVTVRRLLKRNECPFSQHGSPVLLSSLSQAFEEPRTFIPIENGKVIIVEGESAPNSFKYPDLNPAMKEKLKKVVSHLNKMIES